MPDYTPLLPSNFTATVGPSHDLLTFLGGIVNPALSLAGRGMTLREALAAQQVAQAQQQRQQAQQMFPQQLQAAQIQNRNALFDSPSMQAARAAFADMERQRSIADALSAIQSPSVYSHPGADSTYFAPLLGYNMNIGTGIASRR